MLKVSSSTGQRKKTCVLNHHLGFPPLRLCESVVVVVVGRSAERWYALGSFMWVSNCLDLNELIHHSMHRIAFSLRTERGGNR